MEATAQGIDARGYLTGWLHGMTGMYLSDINAIPEDKLTVSPGGVARTVNDISADALGLIHWVTEAIKGNVILEMDESESAKLAETLITHAAIGAAFSKATGDLAVAINEASDERLNSIVRAPFGMKMPLFMMAQVAASHIWYHDGQLNYFQALHGDGEIHWQMG